MPISYLCSLVAEPFTISLTARCQFLIISHCQVYFVVAAEQLAANSLSFVNVGLSYYMYSRITCCQFFVFFSDCQLILTLTAYLLISSLLHDNNFCLDIYSPFFQSSHASNQPLYLWLPVSRGLFRTFRYQSSSFFY